MFQKDKLFPVTIFMNHVVRIWVKYMFTIPDAAYSSQQQFYRSGAIYPAALDLKRQRLTWHRDSFL